MPCQHRTPESVLVHLCERRGDDGSGEMRLVVQSPGGQPRQIDVLTRIDQGKRVHDFTQGDDIWDFIRELEDASDVHRFFETADKGLFVWNVPSFMGDVSVFKQIAARLPKYESVVFDLRGNPGGQEDTLTCLLGFVLDHDVVLPTAQDLAAGRDPVLAKAVFLAGKLILPEDAAKQFPYVWD
jgi:hypothetical protein